MLQAVFVTSSDGSEGKNFEHIMRAHFLSRSTELVLLVPASADFSAHVATSTRVIRPPRDGKAALFLYGSWWILKNRRWLSKAVIVTEPSTVGALGFVARVIAGSPWVVDVWDIPLRYTGSRPLTRFRIDITRWLFRHLYRAASLFIVGIRPDLEFCTFRIPPNRILAWPTTIWIPEPTNKRGERRTKDTLDLLCMRSRHRKHSGLDVLAAAFSIIEREQPRVRLTIIGDIDEDVEPDIVSLRESEKVKFTGHMAHDHVLEMVRDADLCVIPWPYSVDKAQLYPTKVMEYVTEGKVLIAPRFGGIAEMIQDGENGLLFNPGDPEDLARAVRRVCDDEGLRTRIEDRARQYNPTFDCRRKNEAILRSLERLAGESPPSLSGISYS